MPVIDKKNGINDGELEFIIDNPYHPYDLESGDWFLHEDLVKQIKDRFDQYPEERFITLCGNSGSGKTSTLKRIAKSPELLGDNYIAIYLDSRDYIHIDKEDLLFYVYKDIIKKLIEMGYKAQEADIVKKRHQKGYTSVFVTANLDSVIHAHNKNNVLVLIFDEFDKLLEKTDTDAIAENISFFGKIEKNWNHFGLILAGDKKLANIKEAKKIEQFLNTAFNISIEKIINEKTITELIVNPVKNHIAYENEAIQKILHYSGKNLYFQQLICHYLVKYLNKKKSNSCTIKDVDVVIQSIINMPIAEFIHGWEYKISPEDRLIASALVDASITEQRGNFYYLKENCLLDDIFGNKINKKVEKLSNLGYFAKIEDRRFTEYPFKIPLYGEWIRHKHPFIEVVAENLNAIIDQISTSTLKKIINETPGYHMNPISYKDLMEIIDDWTFLKNNLANNTINLSIITKEHHNAFIKKISSFLNLGIKSVIKDDNCYILNIKKLDIGNLEELHCIFQESPELNKEEVSYIENTATHNAEKDQKKATLFFYFQEASIIENFVKKPFLNLIAFEENDLKRIIISQKPRETFKIITLSRLSLQKVNPYQTAGPAKATFYGRSDILNRIGSSKNKSFSIVGARKIGKTSLLDKFFEDPPPDSSIIYLNLDLYFPDPKGIRNFLQALENKIKETFKIKNAFGRLPFNKKISKLPDVIKNIAKSNKHTTFIFDEIDGLLEFDRNNQNEVMRTFRTLAQQNLCQFIFAGFKELYQVQRDMENPLFNFCEEIKLTPLENQSALELITKPMENIGVHYKNTEDRELILYYTGCHPNLLQHFCKKLIEKIEKHDKPQDRRTILADDIEHVYNTGYQEYLLDDIYLFKTEMSTINRLILVLLVQHQPEGNGKTVSVEEIKKILAIHDIKILLKELHLQLKYLVMRFVLLDEGKDVYKFAIPVFPEILRNNIDDHFKYELIEEIKAHEIQSI